MRGFLRIPPERDPGTVFAYNQPATYSLAAIVQRVTGRLMTEYLRPRLFDPLGIGDVTWLQYPAGREIGFTGLYATTDAVARLGQLYLREGVWEGERLLPSAWVAEATRAQVSNADGMSEGPDWQQGYGFQFWMSRHGYRGDGAYGQLCVVLPEHDVVIAATAATEPMQPLLDLVWAHLLPAFGAQPLEGRAADDTALRHRLSRLALPPLAVEPVPPTRPEDWPDATFIPEGVVCADQPTLTDVVVTRTGGAWRVLLGESGTQFELRLDGTGWTVDEGGTPTAVTGGWTDPDTLRVDTLFLETPHRLTVTCSLPGRTFTARWHTKPLIGGPLRSFRAAARWEDEG